MKLDRSLSRRLKRKRTTRCLCSQDSDKDVDRDKDRSDLSLYQQEPGARNFTGNGCMGIRTVVVGLISVCGPKWRAPEPAVFCFHLSYCLFTFFLRYRMG
jgi:hypothetical protein